MSNAKFTVSVVMPAYNSALYIQEALDSVLQQTLLPDEIIVVDDKSTDNTVEIIKHKYTKTVTLIELAQNAGQAVARNVGAQHAKGNIFLFFDSDDRMHPDLIVHMVSVFKNSDADVVFADFIKFSVEEDLSQSISRFKDAKVRSILMQIPFIKLSEYVYAYQRSLLPELLDNNFIAFPVMIKKEVFEKNGGFDIRLSGAEDYDLWLRLANNNVRFACVDRVLSYYRKNAAGTFNSVKACLAHIQCYRKLLADSNFNRKMNKIVKVKMVNLLSHYALQCRSLGKYKSMICINFETLTYSYSLRIIIKNLMRVLLSPLYIVYDTTVKKWRTHAT